MRAAILLLATFVLQAVCLSAEQPEVVVVRGTLTEKLLPDTEGRGVPRYLKNVTRCLDESGVRYNIISDEAVAAGKLEGYRLAIFAYNPKTTSEEVAAIKKFIENGGKVFFFCSIPDEIAELLGVRKVRYLKQKQPGDFAAIKFVKDAVTGLPERAQQASWHCWKAEGAGHGAKIIGTWLDKDGRDTGVSAVILSERGAFMTHILLSDDFRNKQRFIFAIVAHFVPGLWREAAKSAVANIGKFARFNSLDDILAEAEKRKASKKALEILAEAKELRDEARRLAERNEFVKAVETAEKAKQLAVRAYCLLVPPRDGEIRGVWMPRQIWTTWDEAMKNLKECGFNVALPVMCSAGWANYPSEIVPHPPEVEGEGDQLKQCLEAARKYGIQVHVWRVNWRLGNAPKEWLEKLESEKRLQVGYDGSLGDGHGSRWLCPSDPRNRKFERDAMLEIVRKYHPDGIHFDYIRYPGSKFCYCDGCRERFQKQTGIRVENWPKDVLKGGEFYERFQDWRRQQITELVKEVSEEARKIQPGIKISAAVFRDWENHRITVGQDWKVWCERGYLDFVCPMDYTDSPERFRKEVEKQVEWVNGTVPLCPGIGAFSSSSAFRSPAELLHQVEIARALGADGFIIFHYNKTLATEFLPALRLSATSVNKAFPLNAPEIRFDLPEPPREMQGGFPAGEIISVKIKVGKGVTGRVELERANGEHLKSFDAILAEDKREREISLKVPEGRSRIAIYGSVLLPDGTSLDYVKRSKPIIGLTAEAVAAIEQRLGPPVVPEGTGPRVGVAVESFGGSAIFEVLRSQKGLRVFRVFNFSEETLKCCDVLVLPQLKKPEALGSVVRNRIRKFVESGGGLIVTHDAVGYRNHFPIIPEVALKGTGNPKEKDCKITREDPITRGFSVGQVFSHSYYDHITIQPGTKSTVLVTDLHGNPVVVKGICGKGRYVAIGMAIGLADNNQDTEPTDAEKRLLINAVRWVAGL